MQEFIKFTDSGGGIREQIVDTGAVVPYYLRFPGWPSAAGILLGSLVASSTASRTNGVVTITATAHGITTGSVFVGFRFYYPGSSSLAAGLYDSILSIPDANTITFSAAGADFSSESINSGAAWTTITDLTTMTIKGNLLKDMSRVVIRLGKLGSAGGGSKTITETFGGSTLGTQSVTSSPIADTSTGFRCYGTNKQLAYSYSDGTSGTAYQTLTKNITVDQSLTVRGTISAAGEFLALIGARVEIIP